MPQVEQAVVEVHSRGYAQFRKPAMSVTRLGWEATPLILQRLSIVW